MNERLRQGLKLLRLSGLAESLDIRREEATCNNMTHAEFLELALQDELAARSNRLIQCRTKSAEFLFEIVMRRHELRSTMMTSNRPLGGLGEADRRRTGRQCYPRSIPASCRIDQNHWKELWPAESRREWPR